MKKLKVSLALAIGSIFIVQAANAVTLRFLDDVEFRTGVEVLQEIIKDFEKLHPRVKVARTQFEWLDLRQQVIIRSAGGTLDDVFALTPPQVTEFYMKGLLDPAPQHLKEDMEKSMIKAWDILKIKGKLYGVPAMGGGTIAFFYNKDLFAEAGVDKPPTTWDEVLPIAQKLTKRDANGNLVQLGIGPFSQLKDVFPYSAWFRSNNAWFWEIKDNKAVRPRCDEPNAIEALTFMHDLIYKHGVCDPKFGGGYFGFVLGKTAMIGIASWVALAVDSENPDLNFASTLVPYSRSGKPFSNIWGWVWGVNSKSEKKELAWEFLTFLKNKENDYRSNILIYSMPGRKANIAKIYDTESPSYVERVRGIIEGYDYALDWSQYGAFPKFQEANDILGAWLDRCIVNNEMTPAEALKGAAAELSWLFEE